MKANECNNYVEVFQDEVKNVELLTEDARQTIRDDEREPFI